MMTENKESIWLSNSNKFYKGSDGKFYQNEDELKLQGKTGGLDDEGEEFKESDFLKLVKSEVSNFVNRSFDNIVVLVSAGASVVVNDSGIDKDYGQTVAMIAQDVYDILKSGKYNFSNEEKDVDVFQLDELARQSKYAEEIVKGDKLLDSFNLEDFLSNLFSSGKFIENDKKKFEDSTRAVLDIIRKATSYDYEKSVFKHVRLLNILFGLIKKEHKLNIVTTNYDTLLEDAAASMDVVVFDGFSFSRVPKFESDLFDWNLVKDVPNIQTKQSIYKPKVVNLLKLHGSLTWELSKSGDNVIRKNKDNVDTPIMIFPSSDKYAQSYQEPYFELFTKFQELLKRPNTLLITTGFSFADNHISRMILSAIQTNDGLATLVTDYNIESDSTNGNRQMMVEAMDNQYNIAFLKATMNNDLTDFLGGTVNDN